MGGDDDSLGVLFVYRIEKEAERRHSSKSKMSSPHHPSLRLFRHPVLSMAPQTGDLFIIMALPLML